MFRNQLKFQVLFPILIIVLSGILILYYISANEIKKTIDKKQLNFYTDKVETILQTLENRYQKLQRTYMVESYEYSFKEFSINELRKIHYSENVKVYPFILNEKKVFILHPSFNEDNFDLYSNNKEYKNIIEVKEGNFDIRVDGVEKWVIFKHFDKWDWIVGYAVPLSLKYDSLSDFRNKFLLLTLAIILLISLSIVFIVRHFLTPIEKLTEESKKISEGDLQSEIKINGSYEITQLSNSLSIMKEKIKQNIDELENKVKERTLELTQSNDELEQIIANLKQTQDKLVESEKMASLGGLVAGVAHEINTPIGIILTGITHFLEINEEIRKKYNSGLMTEEEFEVFLQTSNDLAQQISRNIERTAHLVRSFKQVAVDQTDENKRDFELTFYLNEVIYSLKNVIKKTNIDIKIDSSKKIDIYSYPGAFAQIFTNLIMNSIRHAFDEKEKGSIEISFAFEDDRLNIVYKDNGKGIKKKDLPYIFDPFFTTNREKGGTGLGLNIIYNIISTQLKGTIDCSSDLGHGVTFLIIIPLNKDK